MKISFFESQKFSPRLCRWMDVCSRYIGCASRGYWAQSYSVLIVAVISRRQNKRFAIVVVFATVQSVGEYFKRRAGEAGEGTTEQEYDQGGVEEMKARRPREGLE